MLFILLGLFIVCAVFFGIMQSVNGDSFDDGFFIMSMILVILSIVIFVITLITLSCYNETKATADKQILILEEKNEIVLKQIEPLIEKYLSYENETLSKFKVDVNNLVALSMFPELKGNEFIKSQIDVVIKNQDEITKLKLSKAKLNAYKLWLFMGE
jgi:Na+/melibiose symporter-like transporter